MALDRAIVIHGADYVDPSLVATQGRIGRSQGCFALEQSQVAAVMDALGRAAKAGVVVVRASRVPLGFVGRNVEVDDDKMNFVAAEELNPPKARVLLRLALMTTKDPKAIQRLFEEY